MERASLAAGNGSSQLEIDGRWLSLMIKIFIKELRQIKPPKSDQPSNSVLETSQKQSGLFPEIDCADIPLQH
jgi:hypothetical protein